MDFLHGCLNKDFCTDFLQGFFAWIFGQLFQHRFLEGYFGHKFWRGFGLQSLCTIFCWTLKPFPMQHENSLPESTQNFGTSRGHLGLKVKWRLWPTCYQGQNFRGLGSVGPVKWTPTIAADLNQKTYKQDQNHAKPRNGERGGLSRL